MVIFDLDGTLADTSQGIYNAHRYTAKCMGIDLKADALSGVIGGELFKIYREKFGLSEENSRKAVAIYRNWYSENGIYQAEIYPDMVETLNMLRSKGYKLAVATLKREDFAQNMLEQMGIAKLFDYIFGMDKADTLNKEKLLYKCVDKAQIPINEAVLIGDSISDVKGAKACNMDFIGVTYGLGFRDTEEVALFDNVISCVSSVSELKNVL